MRPDRDDIAAPDFAPGIEWLGETPKPMSGLAAAGPVLVHFIDYAQLNSVRTLPYLAEWERRYRNDGLSVVAIQSPRFPFGAEREAVASGLAELDVSLPVAIDVEHRLWHAYGCEGWPSLFLWGLGGVLRWFHFGEGEYRATEDAIQDELRELDALRELPQPMEPLRATDAPGARVMPPSAEHFPGGSWERPWTAGQDGEEIELDYAAGGAFATVEGEGRLDVAVDGDSLPSIPVSGPRLYALAEHPRNESHHLSLRPSPSLRIWSVSFAAGLP